MSTNPILTTLLEDIAQPYVTHATGKLLRDILKEFEVFKTDPTRPKKTPANVCDVSSDRIGMYRFPTRYDIVFDMPGVKKADVSITVEQLTDSESGLHKLVIAYDRHPPFNTDLEHDVIIQNTNAQAKGCEQVILPMDADYDTINATLQDGVLYIMIPKTVKAVEKVKKVDIQ